MSENIDTKTSMIENVQICIANIPNEENIQNRRDVYKKWHKFFILDIRVNKISENTLGQPDYNIVGATLSGVGFDCDVTVKFDGHRYDCRGYGYCCHDITTGNSTMRYVLDRLEVTEFIETTLIEHMKSTAEWNYRVLRDMCRETYPSISNDIDIERYGYIDETGKRQICCYHILMSKERWNDMTSMFTGGVMQMASVVCSSPSYLDKNDHKELARDVINLIGWVKNGRYTDGQARLYIEKWYELAGVVGIDMDRYYEALQYLSDRDSVAIPEWVYDKRDEKVAV